MQSCLKRFGQDLRVVNALFIAITSDDIILSESLTKEMLEMYEPYAIKLAKEFKVESRVSMVSVEIINNWEKLCDQIDELIEQHYSELIN